MAPGVDTAIDSPSHGSQNARLTLISSDDSQGSTQHAFRSRSDSLDIFTMSPLGASPSDFYSNSNSQVGPSTPRLRLPDPPVLDLDLVSSNSSDQLAAIPIPHRSPSPPSTPNSPTAFSFSPPRYSGYQHRYGTTVYPVDPQCAYVAGGASYGTDITSVAGSWDSRQTSSENSVGHIQDEKGKKSAQLAPYGYSTSALEPSPSKGKGKAIEQPVSSSLHGTSFGRDFGFQHVQDLSLEVKSTQSHGDRGVTENDTSDQPVVRLSSGSQYRLFGEESAGIDAGPTSRNRDISADVSSIPGPGSSRDAQRSSASYSGITSPPITSLVRSVNESSPQLHLPAHCRSPSSLSLRSLRSSSSRSLASIRSTFMGEGIRGRVRSMAPAAKKLKGGLRKVFKRNPAGRSGDAAAFTLSDDDDDTDDEAEHSKLAQLAATMSPQDSPTDTQSSHAPSDDAHKVASVTELEVRGGISSGLQVKQLAISGTFSIPENKPDAVSPVLSSKHRGMSEPIPFTSHDGESSDRPDQGEHTLMAREQTEEIKQTCQDIVVWSNPFNDLLPRELQLAVFEALVSIHEEEHQRAECGESHDQMWTVRVAGKTRWIGRDKGLRELVKLSRVSKTWQSLVFDGQLWDVLNLASSPPHLPLALLLRLVAHAGSFVRSLSLRGWTHLDPVTLRALVHSLTLFPTETDELLGPLQRTESITVPSFPTTNLTHVSLRTCTSLTTHSLHHVLLRAPSLRSVDLRGLGAVTNTTCGVLSAYCPGIELVDLGRCPNMDADGLLYLLHDGVPGRYGTSGESNFPSRDIGMKRSDALTSSLRVLRASGLKRLNEDVLTTLGKAAPHLEVLDLSDARDLTDKAVEAFVVWNEAWDLPSYTSYQRKIQLSAREMDRDPATESGPCVKRTTRLRHLNLSSCLLLTDLACTHLAHCVPELEFLELAGIGQDLKDDGLVRLLATTPLLRRLDLEDASDITDAVLEVLTASVPSERGVRVQPPRPPPGRNLEHLVLSYALSITNDGLLGLIRTCQRLKVLECDNTRISGMVLREFVKLARQRQLRGAEVVAVDCRAITESLVRDLASSGRTRARKGYRHYEARLFGYVDSKDGEDLGAAGILGGMDVDDCDDTRVAIKSFWSWQAVDAIRQARAKRRKLALNARRATDAGVLGEGGFKESGLWEDDEELLFGTSGAGPSSRPGWLSQWARLSGSGSSSPTGASFASEDERGCIIL